MPYPITEDYGSDTDGWYTSQLRFRKAAKRAERQREKQRRREEKLAAKKTKSSEKKKQGEGAGILPAIARFFGFEKGATTEEAPSERQRKAVRKQVKREQQVVPVPTHKRLEYADLVYPAPPVPYSPPTYRSEDVHPEPSIFLEECGMVRVRSHKVGDGGWTVVPKSDVLWD
jgi:hypothetical protein